MSNAPARLVALVLAILIGGAAWLLWPSSQPGPAVGGLGDNGTQPVALEGAHELPDLEPESRPPAISGAAERVAVAPQPTAPKDQVAEPHRGRLVGRVVDVTGQPLEGVRVIAGGSDMLPLDIEVGGLASRWQTVSGPDGRFELAAASSGELRVGARAAGFAPLDRGGLVLPSDEDLDVGDLALQQGVALDGRVVLAGGGAIEGARLMLERPGLAFFGVESLERPLAVTDAAGHFRIDQLAAGPWRLRVESDGNPDQSFNGVVEHPGETRTGLVFEVERGASIRGRVVGAPQQALEGGLTVSARPGGNPDLNVIELGELADLREADVAADGSFEILGCKPGQEYSLALFEGHPDPSLWPSHDRTRAKTQQAFGGDAGIALEWIGTTALELRVVDAATGRPLEDLRVRYGRGQRSDLIDEDGDIVRHFPGGRVALEDLGSGRAGDPLVVELQSLGYRTELLEFEPRSGERLDGGLVSLQPAKLLSFHVLAAADGTPVEDAEVAVRVGGPDEGASAITINGDGSSEVHGDVAQVHRGKTDADGRVQLSSIEGQVGRLTVKHPDFTELVVEDLSMPRGEALERELLLLRGGDVRVRVRDAAGQVLAGARVEERPVAVDDSEGGIEGLFSVSFSTTQFGERSEATNADGETTFMHLEPGAHEFRLAERASSDPVAMVSFGGEDQGEPWTLLEVTEGGTHELELVESPRASLTGRLTEAGQPLAGALVQLIKEGGEANPMRIPGLPGPLSARTDGRGRFDIAGAKPGSYTLEISHPSRAMPASASVELGVGANSRDVDLAVSVVEGRVSSPDGEPLAGIRVSAKLAHPSSGSGAVVMMVGTVSTEGGGTSAMQFSSEPDPTLTDAEGRYRLRGVAPNVELIVRAEGDALTPASSEPFEVGPNKLKSDVDLILSPSGAVMVALEGASGMLLVHAKYLGEESGVADKHEIATGKQLKLDGLRPGPWQLSLERLGDPRAPGDSPMPEPQEIEVLAGEVQPVSFSL